MKDIKVASTAYIKKNKLFSKFSGWQDGYGAFTYSINDKDKLIEYVKNQDEHHKRISFKEEFIALLKEQGIAFDEKYLLKEYSTATRLWKPPLHEPRVTPRAI